MGASPSATPAQGRGRMRHQDLQGPSRALESSAGAASGSSGSWACPAPHRAIAQCRDGGSLHPGTLCCAPVTAQGSGGAPRWFISPLQRGIPEPGCGGSPGRRGWHWAGWLCSGGCSRGGVLPLSLSRFPEQPLEGHPLLPAWHQHPGVVPQSSAVPAAPDKGHTGRAISPQLRGHHQHHQFLPVGTGE